ncbi:uncharacterized protein HMPREF1541_07164 [Cyphellophora europaea CBS 101466]|uniref:Flavoprotein oxygenase n=1 Tax=Cyphellophora europaea (strain CBS 101466) TaxID=1220924 RepID=W2RM38_CYPE1|nr:uncharacterized protein HMPREF1541_07164 [Cyphellophora europaea CBS 101466]ETN37542.1 hypothetical protein HMPREF1541_07164 [Cyphellophora europaea CBS 101466]
MSESTVEVEDFAFQQSSPLSLRQSSVLSSPPAPPLGDPVSTNFDYNLTEDPFKTDDRLLRPSASIRHGQLTDDRRISGNSSISSFPASVLRHEDERTPSVSPIHLRHGSTGSFSKTPSPRRNRGFGSAFRHPSSIREMQLNDDTGDDTESVMSHHRSGSRMSVRSHGSSYSTNTSPSKRSSRSAQKRGSGLKKEFPLVLLHCTLLPPANNWLGPACDKDLFAALLPEPYRQRWTQLQDRLGSAELRSRGILLPHPQEDYELLEERLLEALELERPRIQSNHYLEHAGDSGFESGSQTESDVDVEDKCPDCGKHLRTVADKKWEIKVFAANGLMRGAAWSAAWRDMEKVDVEIGMWMPEDIRQEMDTRLDALKAAQEEAEVQQEQRHDQAEGMFKDRRHSYERQDPDRHAPAPEAVPRHEASTPQSTLQLFVQDRRNIAIVILSILVLVYAVLNARGQGASSAPAGANKAPNTTHITSTEVWTTTIVAHDETTSLGTIAQGGAEAADPGTLISAKASETEARTEETHPAEATGARELDPQVGDVSARHEAAESHTSDPGNAEQDH